MYTRKVATTTTPKRTKLVKNNNQSVIEITSEHELQKACVEKLRAHNMLCFCTDVMNGISFIKDIAGKAIYKQHMLKMGAICGQSDLIILHNKKCTFVEFKWKKGKKSPDQKAFTEKVSKLGYEVLEWRTVQECMNWIIENTNLNKITENDNACI